MDSLRRAGKVDQATFVPMVTPTSPIDNSARIVVVKTRNSPILPGGFRIHIRCQSFQYKQLENLVL